MVFLVLFMVTLALAPSVFALREWRAWYLLRRYGIETEGRIQHHWMGRLGLFDHYYVIYEFDGESPDGEFFFHTKYCEVDQSIYGAIDRGEPPIVRYASVRPSAFRLKGQNPQPLNPTIASLFAWMWAAFFILIALS